MKNFTGYAYPLSKLTLFSASLPVQGMENFGLILLNEQWVAYPMYPVAHTILAHEIVHQWVGNIVTIDGWEDLCLQVITAFSFLYRFVSSTDANGLTILLPLLAF